MKLFILLLFVYASAQIPIEWGQCPPDPPISPPLHLKTKDGIQFTREAIRKDLEQLLQRTHPFHEQKMSHLEAGLLQSQQMPVCAEKNFR